MTITFVSAIRTEDSVVLRVRTYVPDPAFDPVHSQNVKNVVSCSIDWWRYAAHAARELFLYISYFSTTPPNLETIVSLVIVGRHAL